MASHHHVNMSAGGGCGGCHGVSGCDGDGGGGGGGGAGGGHHHGDAFALLLLFALSIGCDRPEWTAWLPSRRR